MGSAHKIYHRSESQVSGSGLGKIKKLPLTATGVPCRRRRRRRREGAASSLNSPALECCELHAASGSDQSSGQKTEKWGQQKSKDGRKTTVDFTS